MKNKKENKCVVSGHNVKSFDWIGWIMSFMGIFCVVNFSMRSDWLMAVLCLFVGYQWFDRVVSGEVWKKITNFNTIINTCYDLDMEGNRLFVSASTPEELDLYMKCNHEGKSYRVVSKFEVESFIKEEQSF